MARHPKRFFDGKSGEQALSVILTYIMPDEQAVCCAKVLLDKFGSFSAVLDAPLSEVEELPALCGHAAYIKMIAECAEYYMEDKNSSMKRVYDTRSAYEILKPKFIGRKKEAVALLLLDGRARIIYNGIINEGSVSEVPIYIRRVVELCLLYDAYTAVIAHNHPSGNPTPSRNDLNATRDVEFALNGIDVSLFDHIIFAGADYTSLKSSEWLEKIKQDVIAYKKTQKEWTKEEEDALLIRYEKNSRP